MSARELRRKGALVPRWLRDALLARAARVVTHGRPLRGGDDSLPAYRAPIIGPRLGVLVQRSPRPATLPSWYAPRPSGQALPSIRLVTPSLGQGRFISAPSAASSGRATHNLSYHVQDGGSTDGTVDALRELAGDWWTWRSEPDTGQAAAINRAFALGDGELMGWLNSDDLLLPGALHAAARFLETHPEVDVVYGHRMMIDVHDRRVGIWVTPRHDAEMLRMADYIPQETVLWRRSLWERVGGLDDSLHYALDWDLFLRFAEAGARFHRIPRFQGAFRVHKGQKTTAWSDVGDKETEYLRRRTAGEPVTAQDVGARLRPYLVHQLLWHHYPYRVSEFVPYPRIRLVDWLTDTANEGHA